MSSREPEPNDEDTGPLHVNSARASAADAEDRRYDAPLSVNPRPVHRNRRPVLLLAAAIAAVIALGVLAWLFWPSGGGSGSSAKNPGPTTETESRQAAEGHLMGMLPRGYAPDACEVVVPAKGALAQVSCTNNTDPGGPLTATYTLAKDSDSLKDLFDDVVSTSSVVDCPGNIQSPGPWRRNATPQQSAGTLVCGFQQSKPTVAWSTDANLMLSEVQSGPQGPNMVQLYTWWASHS
ncbi:hypothetical protein Mycch_4632 [Mycolicibacterium chubuense NBB4]|uniref:Uncharacterized protein n=1 Tax=Mycolicibacterium chubuense (strain NBB4) TaxID=710421 RepID=I4BPX7_MYCCN|nr:hypothetical protein [Mycolicibacterium chubuense]AFM19334.1 hypothetical protein Mycch_4632 [Mycolicibacterium chubuense NBB4]